jgi:glycosyltransferase involved in cell wall biosynthesis
VSRGDGGHERAPRVLVSGVLLGQPMGGVRRHNAELLARAARLLAERGGALALLEGRAGIPLELPPEVERLSSAVPAAPAWRRFLAERRALRRTLAEARRRGRPFDLVHLAHLPVPDLAPVPVTLTLHGLRWLALPDVPPLRRALARRALASAGRRAAAVIAVSAAVARGAAELVRARIEVLPNGSAHLPLLPWRAGRGAPLLAVGHLEPAKNLGLLLRALAVDPGLPELVLAGASKRGEEPRLRRAAAELGVAARVRFLGLVDEARLAELYAGAAAVVVPSLHEGFGLTVVEALRAGAPLAVADAGALPEVAGPGVPRFDPRDPTAAARAIRAALSTPPAELAARAERVVQRFDWDTSARGLVDLWSELSARATGR